jgi:hypothetical protein
VQVVQAARGGKTAEPAAPEPTTGLDLQSSLLPVQHSGVAAGPVSLLFGRGGRLCRDWC